MTSMTSVAAFPAGCDKSVSASTPAEREQFVALPTVGDRVFHFRLCRELGRGTFARIFLAEQDDLAGRLVVLKVSKADGREPQLLAQLQHTHIVPIYSVHEDPAAGWRAVCMPYFGGASLARVLEVLRSASGRPTRGEQLVQALRTAEAAIAQVVPPPSAPQPERVETPTIIVPVNVVPHGEASTPGVPARRVGETPAEPDGSAPQELRPPGSRRSSASWATSCSNGPGAASG